MRRVFVTNLALVLVLNLLVKPFYILGIDAEVQVRAGTEAYGMYAALLSLSFLLNILLDFGITNWNTRHIAQNTAHMRDQVSGILTVRALLAFLYGAVIMIVAIVIGYRGTQLTLLAILAFNQLLVSTILYLRSNIAGSQRFAQDSLLSVLDRVLLIGICAWLLWGRFAHKPVPIVWFAFAQTAAYGITALIAFALVAKYAGFPRPRWKGVFTRDLLRQSFPFALLVLLMSFYYRTDTLMLERMSPDGARHAGIYAQGFRFFESFNMLGFLFAGLLLPMFSRMLKEKTDVGPLTGLALRLVLTGTLIVAVIGCFYSSEVLRLRYHESTEPAAPPAFAVMIWSFVAVCITYIFGTLLTASGDLRTLNWMAACGMVLNIGLNLVLIPRYQALGAAWAGLITQSLTALAQVLIAARKFHLRPSVRHLSRALLYAAALVAIAAVMASHGLSLSIAAPAIMIMGLAVATSTGMLPLAGLRSVLPGMLSRRNSGVRGTGRD